MNRKYKVYNGALKKIPIEIIEDLNVLSKFLTYDNPKYWKAKEGQYYYKNIDPFIRAYKMSPTHIFVPRYFSIKSFIKKSINIDDIELVDDYLDKPLKDDIEFETFDYDPRFSYQDRIIDYSMNNGSFLIKAPPGSGKTVMSYKIVAMRKQVTIIIVPTTTIRTQWERLFKDKITNANIKVQKGNPTKDDSWEDVDIMITTFSSLLKVKRNHPFTNHFGLCVIDEAHLAGAERFNDVISMFSCKDRIAVTATPNRADGMTHMLYGHVGKNIVSLDYEDTNQKKPTIYINGFDTTIHNKNYRNVTNYISGLWHDETFVSQVVAFIVEKFNERNKSIVLVSRKHGVNEIYKRLKKKMEAYNIQKVLGTNDIKDEDYDILVANYQKIKLGYDNEAVDSMFIISEGATEEFCVQTAGRILRKQEGKLDPVIYDIHDIKGAMKATVVKRCRYWKSSFGNVIK